mmetsp:Transcript_26795/g.70370  ORF Transcript_26795/g.70370 Transcript_26795/m.70370 type:complete len:207 (-) Transcript_26795:208-828(-)
MPSLISFRIPTSAAAPANWPMQGATRSSTRSRYVSSSSESRWRSCIIIGSRSILKRSSVTKSLPPSCRKHSRRVRSTTARDATASGAASPPSSTAIDNLSRCEKYGRKSVLSSDASARAIDRTVCTRVPLSPAHPMSFQSIGLNAESDSRKTSEVKVLIAAASTMSCAVLLSFSKDVRKLKIPRRNLNSGLECAFTSVDDIVEITC